MRLPRLHWAKLAIYQLLPIGQDGLLFHWGNESGIGTEPNSENHLDPTPLLALDGHHRKRDRVKGGRFRYKNGGCRGVIGFLVR